DEVDVRRGEDRVDDLALVRRRRLVQLDAEVQADDDELGAGRPDPAGVGTDAGGVDQVHRPAGGRGDAVQAVRVREVADPHAAHVVHRQPAGLVEGSGAAGVPDAEPVVRVQGR